LCPGTVIPALVAQLPAHVLQPGLPVPGIAVSTEALARLNKHGFQLILRYTHARQQSVYIAAHSLSRALTLI